MDVEKITQNLKRRFDKPLPEFYKRRLVFWHDEEGEFADQVDSIETPGVKVVRLDGSNSFAVKKLLTLDDPTSDYLVYCPFPFNDKDEDNWLLNLEYYSGEPFHADLVAMLIDDMGMQPNNQALRDLVKRYRKFFKSKERRRKVSELNGAICTTTQALSAILATISGSKSLDTNEILRAALKGGLDAATNEIYQGFLKYEVADVFWKFVSQTTGYSPSEAPDLGELARHILLTAASRSLDLEREGLEDLRDYASAAHSRNCYDFVSDWFNATNGRYSYKQLAEEVETALNLPERLRPDKFSYAELLETDCFPCFDELILAKLGTEVKAFAIQGPELAKAIDKRRSKPWYDQFEPFYECLLQVSKMLDFIKAHAAGYHTTDPERVWNEYTQEYYLMDSYYREFRKSYSEASVKASGPLSKIFNEVGKEVVEGLYKTRYLSELGTCWINACADDMKKFGKVPKLPQQTDFYSRLSSNFDKSGKRYVIISDGMRYEVGAELAERLRRETQADVKLGSMQGIFPTETKFGMAALLPHRKLTTERRGKALAVFADGQSTDMPYREKVLKAVNPSSVVLKYDVIKDMKFEERRELVRDKAIVYIYHDRIDAIGHENKGVFNACSETINELMRMVRIIVNEWSGANIVITSDHGFLYTDDKLKEDSKTDMTAETEQRVDVGPRFAILTNDAVPDHLVPVKFFEDDAPYVGYAPRGIVRIKVKGKSSQYVHGGLSLQEMVVPVISYHYLRTNSKKYQENREKYDAKPVELCLMSTAREIFNSYFSLDFFQSEPVGDNRSPATYNLYFVNHNNKKISDVQKIVADKPKTGNNQDRVFRVNFTMKPQKELGEGQCYLVIENGNPKDETGRREMEAFTINIVDET